MQKLRPLKLGKSRKIFKKLLPFIILAGILITVALSFVSQSSPVSYVSSIISGTSLESSGNRINILLLGIAGGAHAGTNLTDTIMIAAYNLKTGKLTLLSIPRDLWLPSEKSKANAVYEKGLSEGDGLGFAKTVMGNIVGLPIHYGLRVDFRGFVSAIDALEGIEVLVENSFDDYLYPISGKENDLCGNTEVEMDFNEEEAKKLNIEAGKRKVILTQDGKIATDSAQEDKGVSYFSCRYEHISFKKGKNQMNGSQALSFVRSRHGTNGEGSDFARSKRQQKVIEAVRNKLLSLETLASPQKIMELLEILGKSIDTDISVKEIPEFYKLSKKLEGIQSFVLDDSLRVGLAGGRKSLFIHPPAVNYGGAYVLISQDDDFSIVAEYVKKILAGEINEYDATASARTR